MKFPDPKTFRGAISPGIVAGWVFGLGTIEYPAGRTRRGWTACCVILHVVCILGSIMTETSDTVITWLLLTTRKISMIGYIYLGQAQSKNFISCLRQVESVNEKLMKMGIPKEYRQVYKHHVMRLIGTGIFVLVHLASVLLCFSTYGLIFVIDPGVLIMSHYGMIVVFVNDFTFITCIRYVEQRFQHLNAYLINATFTKDDKEQFLRFSARKESLNLPTPLDFNSHSRRSTIPNERWMIHVLRNTKERHHDLCSIARNLNNAFGLRILLSIYMSFSMIITMLYMEYLAITAETKNFPQYVLTIGHVLITLMIVYYLMMFFNIVNGCSTVSTEAQSTSEIIFELAHPSFRIDVRDEIDAFLLQLMQNPLEFTANGLFGVNHGVICMIVGTVATYLVVMIQQNPVFMTPPVSWNSTETSVNTTA